MKNPGISKRQTMAWVIACEGWIGLSKSKRSRGDSIQYCPSISISNSNLELLEKLKKLMGYGRIYKHRNYNPGKNWKDMNKWVLNSQEDIKNCLKEMILYLPIKKRQAELLLEYIRNRPKKGGFKFKGWEKRKEWRDEEIYQELKRLNKRGRK